MKKILAVLLCFIASSVWAWEPTKPITVLIGFGPGSGNEVSFRAVAAEIERANPKVKFLVQNMPGADSIVSANTLARSAPDGYTINITGNLSTYVASEIFNADAVKYQPGDIVPILTIGTSPLCIITQPSNRVNNVKELVAHIKSTPTNIGSGSSTHHLLYSILVNHTNAGNQTKMIRYKGPAQVLADVVGGHVEFGILPLSVAASNIESGKVKLVGLSGETKVTQFPKTQLVKDHVPNAVVMAMWNVSVPKNTPQNVIDWYVNAFKTAMATPEVKKFFHDNYMSFPNEVSQAEAMASVYKLKEKYGPIALKLRETQ